VSQNVSRDFVRIIVRGADRAKFLHNFCTNNIKAMTPGQLLEAFFVNVQAKVLAHGYVAAFESHHEIWMVPGDPNALVKHLSRYVISEDVHVELAEGVTKIFRVVAASGGDSGSVTSGCLSQANGSIEVHSIWFNWASVSLAVFGGSEQVCRVTREITALYKQIDSAEVEQLRIKERFPIVGTDITMENLAPEADRNLLAISYTKGCYLGQEPIARIDALGHVNKSLKLVRLRSESGNPADSSTILGCKLRTSEDQTDDRNVAGTVTSCVDGDGVVLCLSILRHSGANQPLRLIDHIGQVWVAEL
jgi:folate-binding protein YgfZ